MEKFWSAVQDGLSAVVGTVNTYLSNYVLLVLLIAIGLFYSIRTRFVQVRFFGAGIRQVFGGLKLNGKKQESGMSSFQALATAIAAQVGTGNIVGASTAIILGGPGAIFWMWIIAFFGMATIYAESTLALKTRKVDEDGTVRGGPVYYITTAFKGGFGKFLAGFFAVAAVLALGFMGAMVQSHAIGSTMNTAFGVPTWVMGLILVVLCGIIFIGGVQRLASVTEKLVPIMAAIFLTGGLVILAINYKNIPATFGLIFKSAFCPKAGIGAGVGTAIIMGAKRGLFSNEAGMGSTPHAHAQANVKDPHDQGIAAMIGVFIDTFVVLTLNALVIISTIYTKSGKFGLGSGKNDGFLMIDGKAFANCDNLAQKAFGSIMGGNLGAIFVAVCLLFFAFSTILSWNLFGKINMVYLFGKKSVLIYTVLALGFTFLGTVTNPQLVWDLTDMFNNLMVVPNVIALFALVKMVDARKRQPSAKKLASIAAENTAK